MPSLLFMLSPFKKKFWQIGHDKLTDGIVVFEGLNFFYNLELICL